MKIRSGFVSNSSSSSFLIINNQGDKITNADKEMQFLRDEAYRKGCLVFPNPRGRLEFGWEWEKSHDIISKINFLTILFYKSEKDEQSTKLKKILEEYFKCEIEYDYDIMNNNSAYIDHQSIEMIGYELFFEEDIEIFIFMKKSYLVTGNDNEYPPAGFLTAQETMKRIPS
jgi:hypothetical protein